MEPETAIALGQFAGKAAALNLGYTVFALLILIGVFALVIVLGEKAIGLDLRKFVDNVEKAAGDGRLWPGIVAFVVVPACLLGLVLFIGLR